MEGKPEEWSNDGGQYLVNHTLQVELKADQGVYYISQESSIFKKTYFINLNQTFPEEKIVKETVEVEQVVYKEVPKEVVRKEVIHVPIYTNDTDLLKFGTTKVEDILDDD